MGACISKSNDPGVSQEGLPPSSRLDKKSSDTSKLQSAGSRDVSKSSEVVANGTKPAAPVAVPVKVFRDAQEVGVVLGSTASGRLQFTITDSVEDAQEAARQMQLSYKGQDNLKALENMRLLLSMGVEVRYCSSNPFIGKLSLRFLEISGTKHAESTYVKVHCEGDRTRPLFATGKGEAEDSAVFDSTPLMFVVIHSNAVVLIKARDKKEGAQFYGQVKVPIKEINVGTEIQEFQLTDAKDLTKMVAIVKVEIGYEYMRGTVDEGAYIGPSRVGINKRKLRAGGLSGPTSLIHHISQQNHWLLSHDNVWAPSSAFIEAEEQKKREREEAKEEAAAESQSLQGPARALMTHTESGLRGNTPAERYKIAIQSARTSQHSEQSASKVMNEGTLLEALGPKEGDSEDLGEFKRQLLALMLALHERVDRTEAVQEQQNAALQELLKSAETGSRTSISSQPQLHVDSSEPFISGTFEYGLGRPAAGRKIYLFINKAQDQRNLHDAMVQFLGVYKTNKKGQLNGIPVPDAVWGTPGHYSVVALLPEDHTFAKGSLFILAPGTKCVIFDMDGTITVGDIQVVTMFALDSLAVSTSAAQNLSHKYDIKARHSALHCVRAWAAKGYQPIYVSGRQGSYYNLTLEWLVKHDYPPGPIHLTRTHLPTLPIYYSVGNFKVEYMEGLKAKGLELYAAYGNTTTDIRAYLASGIPLERTFIIGPHGGKGGSVKIDNFTDHIPSIFEFPDPEVPIPYTELLITANPGYKRHRPTRKGPNGAVRSYSRSSQSGTTTISDLTNSQSLDDLDDAMDDDIDEDVEAEAQAQAADGRNRMSQGSTLTEERLAAADALQAGEY